MNKLQFIQTDVSKELRKTFPKSEIISHKKFSSGLVSRVYKVHITRPKKIVVVKIYKTKRKDEIMKTNKILAYLKKKNIPVPKIYTNDIVSNQGILVLEFLKGENLFRVYRRANKATKRKILFESGKMLRKIHDQKIQKFWKHERHEVKNKKEWIDWTNLRIKKYLKFADKKLNKNYQLFLKERFLRLSALLKKDKDFRFVAMHWDYHFYNINATPDGKITGVFDFDNAMKGHNIADIGQTFYWILLKTPKVPEFSYFLKGYGGKFSEDEKEMIQLYALLHAAAVMRTNWDYKRLQWLMRKHRRLLWIMRKYKMLDKFISGEYKIK